MTRLTRNRRGKTPIDVGVVDQGGPVRVRITVGDDEARPSAKKNSDLTPKEAEDLAVMLMFYAKQVKETGRG